MKNTVLVMISTYNGQEKIIKQVESIINQQDVDVKIKIRDDGSNEETLSIISGLVEKYPKTIEIVFGENIGWKRSFIELLYSSDLKYDYYAFSDQDDIWLDHKLINCIRLMERDENKGIKMAHCNSLSVDSELNERKEQERRIAYPSNYKAAIATEYFQGCGMVWNKEAMCRIKKYKPVNTDLAHDYWVGLICYLFGKVYFIEKPQFYHIRYADNSSADGNVYKGRLRRLTSLMKGKSVYMNPSKDLVVGYRKYLESRQEIVEFLNKIQCYRQNRIIKLSLIMDKQFVRPSKLATIIFKYNILSNRY